MFDVNEGITVTPVPEKLLYEIEVMGFDAVVEQENLTIRHVARSDLADLAALMLDAYAGTIDDEGEDLEDAIAEVESFLSDPEALLDRSYLVEKEGRVASAVLVTMSGGAPLIGYVMTRAGHKGQGLARSLVVYALNRLAEDGYERVALYITQGNTPSEALFRSVGARLAR